MTVKMRPNFPVLEFKGQKWGSEPGLRDINELPESIKEKLVSKKKLIEVKESKKDK